MIFFLVALGTAWIALRLCRFVQSHSVRQYAWAAAINLAACGALLLLLPDLTALRLMIWGLSAGFVIFSLGIFWRSSRLLAVTDVKPLRRRYLRSGYSAPLHIQQESFPGPLSAWALLSAAARGRVYVICVDGLPVALAVVERLPGINWLSYLAVDSDHRRQGHARALLSELGCLALTVRADNAQALSLYRAVGFVQVARWPHYYGRSQAADVLVRAKWKNYSEK